jgi:hypothetical protein
MKKSIGKPCEGKLHARFDEGGADCFIIFVMNNSKAIRLYSTFNSSAFAQVHANKCKTSLGMSDENGAAPLYDYPKGENVIQYFSQLQSISDSAYYDKYVRINIDGIWEADNIREAFNFGNRLSIDTDNACKVLSKFSDKEIKSVFRFIFDGPHPDNEMNEGIYKDLKQKIDSQNARLSQLLTESYNELLAEDDGHGH